MKIETAKLKWCPFAMAKYSGHDTSVNRDYGSASSNCRCLADGCMAWRTVLNDPTDGHCGLAGFAPHGGGE